MSITIRPASMDDYDAINALMRQVDQDHIAAYPELFRPVEPPRSREFIAEWLGGAYTRLWLAEQDGAVAGLIQFDVQAARDFPLLVPRRYVVIDTLVVDAAFRRQGVGQALMAAVHDWGIAQGLDEFELGVYSYNAEAQAFYERLGYEVKFLRMWRK